MIKSFDAYQIFWQMAFALPLESFFNEKFELVSGGRYLEKHGDAYVFIFENLVSGKCILAAPSAIADQVKATLSTSAAGVINAETVMKLPLFQNYATAFSDIDYGFSEWLQFQPQALGAIKVRRLTLNDSLAVQKFYENCSEDDKDTLDLNLEQDFALAVYNQQELLAIARFTKIRDTELADITVVTRTNSRGQSLSTPLVSMLMDEIMKIKLVPKYRVGAANMASIAIAQRLGLKPLYRITTFEVPTLK